MEVVQGAAMMTKLSTSKRTLNSNLPSTIALRVRVKPCLHCRVHLSTAPSTSRINISGSLVPQHSDVSPAARQSEPLLPIQLLVTQATLPILSLLYSRPTRPAIRSRLRPGSACQENRHTGPRPQPCGGGVLPTMANVDDIFKVRLYLLFNDCRMMYRKPLTRHPRAQASPANASSKPSEILVRTTAQ